MDDSLKFTKLPYVEMNLSLIRQDCLGFNVAGRQLFPFNIFSEGGHIVCQMCRSQNVTTYWESMPIDLEPHRENRRPN